MAAAATVRVVCRQAGMGPSSLSPFQAHVGLHAQWEKGPGRRSRRRIVGAPPIWMDGVGEWARTPPQKKPFLALKVPIAISYPQTRGRGDILREEGEKKFAISSSRTVRQSVKAKGCKGRIDRRRGKSLISFVLDRLFFGHLSPPRWW